MDVFKSLNKLEDSIRRGTLRTVILPNAQQPVVKEADASNDEEDSDN